MRIPIVTDAIERAASNAASETSARYEAMMAQTAVEQAEESRAEVQRAEQRGQLKAFEEIIRTANPQTSVTSPYDYAYSIRQFASPRRKPQQALSVDEMRRLARIFDVLRIPIEHLKREVRSVRWKIAPRDRKADDERTLRRCQRAWRFFETSGGNGEFGRPRSRFETQILDDLLVTGCFAVARFYDETGRLVQQGAVDSGTIKVRVDESGWTDPDYPYEQWLQGGQRGNPLTRDDLYYGGVNAVTTSPYYVSPIEWLLAPILGGMRADEWNRAFFEGDHPGGLMLALSKDLTPDQVTMWRGFIREALEGDTIARRSLITVPEGTGVVSDAARRDQEFEQFEMWMLRRVFAVFGVSPSAAGFAGEQYKVAQEGSNEQTSRFGASSVVGALKELYDDTLELLGYGDLEVVEAGDDETIQDLAPAVVSLNGVLSTNEKRKLLGYPPIAGGDDLKPSETAEAAANDDTKPSDDTTGGDAKPDQS